MKRLILCFILIQSPLAFSQSDDDLPSAEKQGLKDTQQFLRNKQERNAFIKKDPKAKDIDTKVEALTGSGADKEEVYDISARVMEKVTAEAKGDPEKMQTLLLEASSNPKAFYEKYFSAEDKKKTKALADKIEKKKGSVPRGH